MRSLWMERPARRARLVRPLLLGITVLMLSACQLAPVREPIDTSHITVDQIGAVRVSVLSVAPWSSYANALQPHFDLDSATALKQAVPTTRLQALSYLRQTTATLGVGLPTKTNTAETTTTDGETSTNQTEKTEPGTPPSVTAPTPPEKQQGQPALKQVDTTPSTLGLEPRLQYQAATSLYQEVQILNRYILDVAQRSGYDPYLVRLQIALMPQRRNLPLDTYVNLTFFASDGSEEATPKSTLVVPLVATDSHEDTLASQTAQAIRAIGASLKSLQQVGVGIDVGNLSQNLEELVGHNINSTFGLGRLSDNSIRVRVGALQGAKGFSMVPRTESVTILVMVPKAKAESNNPHDRLIHVISMSQFVDTNTGVGLQTKLITHDEQDVQTLRADYLPPPPEKKDLKRVRNRSISDDKFGTWWNYVLENRLDKFSKELDELVCDELQAGPLYCTNGKYRYKEQLWAEIASLQLGYTVDTLRFEVPRTPPAELFPEQAVVLTDDGARFAYARVYYGAGLRSSDLCAALRIPRREAKPGGQASLLAAQQISLDGGGRQAVFRFDSLAALGLAPSAPAQGNGLELLVAQDPSTSECWKKFAKASDSTAFKYSTVDYRLQPTTATQSAGFTIAAATGFLTPAQDTTSSLVLVIEPDTVGPTRRVTVDVRGANISSAKVGKTAITPLGTRVDVDLGWPPKRRDLALVLKGVVVGESVSVDSWNAAGTAQKQIQLAVRKR